MTCFKDLTHSNTKHCCDVLPSSLITVGVFHRNCVNNKCCLFSFHFSQRGIELNVCSQNLSEKKLLAIRLEVEICVHIPVKIKAEQKYLEDLIYFFAYSSLVS